MKFYITLIGLCFIFFGFSQELPKNPKLGECYVRCKSKDGKFLEWKNIDCKLVATINRLKLTNLTTGIFNENDRKVINKKLIRALKKGYSLELISHYYSVKSDAINQKRAIQNAKALLSYIQTQGIETRQLVLSAYGNSKPLKECNNKNSCLDFYNKNTRMEYRFINAPE